MWCSSIAILIYGYAIFQKRLTMISARDAAQFGTSFREGHSVARRGIAHVSSYNSIDQLWGPLLICAAMFIAILTNFIVRVREMCVSRRHTSRHYLLTDSTLISVCSQATDRPRSWARSSPQWDTLLGTDCRSVVSGSVRRCIAR